MRGALALLAVLFLISGAARPVAGEGSIATVQSGLERRVPPSPASGVSHLDEEAAPLARLDTPRSGWASHCIGCWPPGRWGAVRSWRWGDVRYSVKACSTDGCVTVTIRDFCACGPRHGVPTVIDLSPEAFMDLSPDQTRAGRRAFLGKGIVKVTVRPVDGRSGPTPTLPPTDTTE